MHNNSIIRFPRSVVLSILLLFFAVPAAAQDEGNWLDRYNRAIFIFNDKVDQIALKPLARGYKAITPELVDRGISNFFSNLGDVVVIVNGLLQLKFDQALQDTNRFAINTTFGLLGIFDLATPLGLPKHDEDFGQTLGYWGVGEGFFFMLPLLGPTTARDVWRLPVDMWLNPVTYVDPTSARFGMRAVDLVDTRADLLSVEQTLDGALLDRYTFFREAYLERRRTLVADGEPAAQRAEDDALFNELDELEQSDPPPTE